MNRRNSITSLPRIKSTTKHWRRWAPLIIYFKRIKSRLYPVIYSWQITTQSFTTTVSWYLSYHLIRCFLGHWSGSQNSDLTQMPSHQNWMWDQGLDCWYLISILCQVRSWVGEEWEVHIRSGINLERSSWNQPSQHLATIGILHPGSIHRRNCPSSRQLSWDPRTKSYTHHQWSRPYR